MSVYRRRFHPWATVEVDDSLCVVLTLAGMRGADATGADTRLTVTNVTDLVDALEAARMYVRVAEEPSLAEFVDDDYRPLAGSCGFCRRWVDGHDDYHRVTAIGRGGQGVQCTLRGDIQPDQAKPLGRRR